MLTFHTTRFSPTPLNHGESVALTLAGVFVPGSFLSRERLNTRSPIRALSSISTFAAGSAHSLLLRKMDPSEYLSPSSEYLPPSPAHAAAAPSPAYPAAAPSPAYAAAALPPTYAAAPPAGPSVFVLSPLPGNIYEADRYFYSPDANVMEGDYAALLTFAGRYGYPLAIYQCPDLAAFQASYPTAIVRPFAEVPASFIARGHELMLSTAASAAPSLAGLGSSPSLLSHPSAQESAQGSYHTRQKDPPSVAAAKSSSIPFSRPSVFPSPHRRPDPEGVDGPSSVFGMGGSRGIGGFGGPGHTGGMGYRQVSSRLPPLSSSSYSSIDDDLRAYNFPGPIPETIPSVVFHRHGAPPPPGVHPHVPASVAHTTAHTVSSLRSLHHGDLSTSSASDITVSGWPSSTGAVPPVVPSMTHPGAVYSLPPATSSSSSTSTHLDKPSIKMEPFKLSEIKDVKSYLDMHDEISFYLRSAEYSTGRSDALLITNPSNAEASRYWEGQLRIAVKNGGLRFLFENTGSRFHGKGFEMIEVLNRHCRPDSVTNAFTTLMSLFNDVQKDTEPIVEFRSRFDGMILDMGRGKVVIPPLLLVMIFLRALHTRYSDILDQFRSRYKDLETASLDSVVADVKYHDEFLLVGSTLKTPRKGGPGALAAAVDKNGKEWSNPFEWISSLSVKTMKTRWDRAIAGTGICPICHRAEKPWHVPANCPLLKDLNLKLVNGPTKPTAPVLAGSQTPAPAAASTTPGGLAASVDESAPTDGAPSGLMAAVEEDEYSSDGDLFRWTGDDMGLDFCVPLGAPNKSNPSVSHYPSCSQVSVVHTTSTTPSKSPTTCTSSSCLILPDHLQSIIRRLATSSISPDSNSRVAVADTGATDHMFPDKTAFISYKRISHLQVRMGNNSYLPVLGRGTVIISLNGKRVLIRHALHVPGLAVPLYSL